MSYQELEERMLVWLKENRLRLLAMNKEEFMDNAEKRIAQLVPSDRLSLAQILMSEDAIAEIRASQQFNEPPTATEMIQFGSNILLQAFALVWWRRQIQELDNG